MSRTIRYITHPQVKIDPKVDVPRWGLNDIGRARVAALAASGALFGTKTVVSSGETKAIETATPLALALGCEIVICEAMHENDRNSTGFLPSAEFEVAADQFFANPTESYLGWETSQAAQDRIVAAFFTCLERFSTDDILFVGHGAVGTLLYCHLADLPISRSHDQRLGGGSFFEITDDNRKPKFGWRLIEELFG